MRRFNIAIISFTLCLISTSALSSTPLETKIKRIIASSVLAPESTAVVLQSTANGNLMLSINGDMPLNPASCAKIITSAAALNLLGPNYRFETIFATDYGKGSGQIHNLYIKSNGNPSYVTEEMEKTVTELWRRGIRSISGDIIIDDSYFDGPWYPRKGGNSQRSYTARTSAVAFNFNSIKFVIEPGSQSGGKAIVKTDPPTSYIKIINKVITGNRFRVSIARKESSERGETYIVSGSIPTRAVPQTFYRSAQNPILHMGSALKEMLMKNGISAAGQIIEGPTPKDAHEIVHQYSKPLTEIISDMNKFSNNFIAEQLTKHLGAVRKGVPGSTVKGISAIQEYLLTLGIRPSDYVLENGSGLSAVSRITAKQITKILSELYRNHALRWDFLESLSILGVDGTMKSWRSAVNLQGVLRAKTGSLNNVTTLSGYVPLSNGDVAAFSILVNGFKKGKNSARKTELMIVNTLAGE